MIRVIQRRLIIPRGDTGIFTIPAMTQAEGAIGVFTIFDPITNTRIFQKQVEIEGENFNIGFSHADTVNLKAGDYLWDIKFYKNPILADNKVIDGEEINSYYAAFQAPKCEIRETGDDFLMIEGQPAKIEDLNIILGATEAANAAKVAATEQAEIAAAKAEEAAVKLEEMIAAMPTKVSDLTDDSGHYVKPASGIPASDLEETYLTQHQDISGKANSADLATVATSGSYNDLEDKPTIPDIQINGASIVDNGIANIPYGNGVTAGIVSPGVGARGIYNTNEHILSIFPANSNMIKTGISEYLPITTKRQHEATFYGLAKAAGDTTQSASNNAVGTYTDEAKSAIRGMLGAVGDIQVDGTSVVTNGIASIPIAENGGDYGVIKVASSNGVGIAANGALYAVRATDAQVKAGTNEARVISPYNQHMSTFYGLAKAAGDATMASSSNAVGTYTDSAKASIKAMLGIQDGSTGTVDVTGTIPTITAVENTRYVCGEVTSLSFTPPASGISIVRFTSGSTVTVLTIPSTVKFPEWFDPTSLETNTIYEICVTDGEFGAVMSWPL